MAKAKLGYKKRKTKSSNKAKQFTSIFVIYRIRNTDNFGKQATIIDLLTFTEKNDYQLPIYKNIKKEDCIIFNHPKYGLKNFRREDNNNIHYINVDSLNNGELKSFLLTRFIDNVHIKNGKLNEFLNIIAHQSLKNSKNIVYNDNDGKYKEKGIEITPSKYYFKFKPFISYSPKEIYKDWRLVNNELSNSLDNNVKMLIKNYLLSLQPVKNKINEEIEYRKEIEEEKINKLQEQTRQQNSNIKSLMIENNLSNLKNQILWKKNENENDDEFEIEVNPLIFEMISDEWSGKLGNYLSFTEFKDEKDGTYKPIMEFNDTEVEQIVKKYFMDEKSQDIPKPAQKIEDDKVDDSFNSFIVYFYKKCKNGKKECLYLLGNKEIIHKNDFNKFNNNDEVISELNQKLNNYLGVNNINLKIDKLKEVGLRRTEKYKQYGNLKDYINEYKKYIINIDDIKGQYDPRNLSDKEAVFKFKYNKLKKENYLKKIEQLSSKIKNIKIFKYEIDVNEMKQIEKKSIKEVKFKEYKEILDIGFFYLFYPIYSYVFLVGDFNPKKVIYNYVSN